MYDVSALGELLIDFTPKGKSENMSPLFEANAGGAPCNVLSQLAKLSKKTVFIGKVGTDSFGTYLKNTIEKYGISSAGLSMSSEYLTTLAFVTLDDEGNRSFSFARNDSADVMLSPEDVDESIIKNSKIFHCGSLSLTHTLSSRAQIKALEVAKESNILISVDPNLRLLLWKTPDDAKNAIKYVLSYADIIKISDYETEFLYGEKDIQKGAKILFDEYKPKILFATCGKDGAYLLKDGLVLYCPCFDNVQVADTTGAGDSFCGAALSKLIDFGLDFENIGENECRELLTYASAAANLATTKYGAMAAMPYDTEIKALINI